MKRVVALADVFYNSKVYHAGDSFEVDAMWLPILIGLGNTRLEDAPLPPPAPLQTRALQAEEPPPPAKPMTTEDNAALVPPQRNKKRSYKRRDMRAED